MDVPFDAEAEAMVIGWLVGSPKRNPSPVLDVLEADDFYKPTTGRIYAQIRDRFERGETWSRHDLDVADPLELAEWINAYTTVLVHTAVERVLTTAGRRRLMTAIRDGSQELADGAAYDVVAASMIDSLSVVSQSRGFADESLSAAEIIANGASPTPWLVPKMIPAQSRTIVVAGEGMGKSMMFKQIGLKIAGGMHPFLSVWLDQPVRVLGVDLENGDEVIFNAVRRITHQMRLDGADIDSMPYRHVRWLDLDLLSRHGRSRLENHIRQHRPDLVILGPIYQSYNRPAKMTEDDAVTHLMEFFDDMRARYGVAWLLEHHAPHASGGAKRDLRPVGSSKWIRWPEFGVNFGSKEKPSNGPEIWEVGRFRGDRIPVPGWPTSLQWGSRYPWEATYPTGALTSARNEDRDGF